ncbi:ABC transporter ATP-binding protein [Sporolactobacillus sp. THM19-2]|uniref:ABC transporter ATP-binding protein n=1 Tax=Sporolactobacillus sp. THM19-2 TaxID=2511171 RepID=UPI0010200692|nr:ABC transporter ATP-binding protein [Sporolactobacillus sp. THM19-2]RYL94629.1 ABC transporter ATP-binding protein [Sporolactobacillus sp. THM19-2]
MNRTTDKTSLKDRWHILWRGMGIVQRMVPSLLPAAAAGALLKSFSPFITIYITARIIDELFGSRSVSKLAFLVGTAIILNLAALLLQKAMERIKDKGDYRLYYFGKIEMDGLILSTDYENVEKPDFHLRKQKIDEACQMHRRGIWQLPELTERFLTSLCTVVFSIILAFPVFIPPASNVSHSFIASPWLSVLFLGMIILSSAYTVWSNARFSKWAFKRMDRVMPINRIFSFYADLMEDHKFGKDVRIYQQQSLISESYKRFITGNQKLFEHDISKKQNRFYGVNAAISSIITGFVYLFVGMKALIGLISIGSVVQYVGAISQFTTGFAELITSATDSWQNIDYVNLYFDFLDTPNPKYKGTLPVEKRMDNDYEIEFRNVSFTYPGAESPALKNISLKLKIGQHFAVVGRNGSGKTTFIKLLTRLYDPQEGEILLNGINIQKYNYQEYLNLFSVVFQDFQLFAFSAGQNVATDVHYDRERAMACLDEAGVGNRIRRMPEGLDTPLYKVGDDGVDISGGEAQKIAIARALYKNAPFVVLDEPTAALDPVAEYEIYAKFQEIVGNKTAIYISHRLSSCRFCDRILVFNKGNLIQSGSHNELIHEENGQYFKLWQAQAQYYKENA